MKQADSIDLNKITLSVGSHQDRADGLCVMELAAWLAGEPHSNRPRCVSPVLVAFLRRWNDDLDDGTRQLLIPYASLILNPAGDDADETRAYLATDWMVRISVPTWLDLAGLREHAKRLRSLPPILDATGAAASLPVIVAARDAARTGVAANWDADMAAAAWAAARAGASATWDAARAAGAMSAAAWDAARAARTGAGAILAAAAWNAARDAAARATAWDAAARAALQPTVAQLQSTIFALLDRMIALRRMTMDDKVIKE